jgi:hypothetical protein
MNKNIELIFIYVENLIMIRGLMKCVLVLFRFCFQIKL